MKRSIFTLFCVFALESTWVSAGIENEQQAIVAADGALGLYYQLSTQTVPWNAIKENLQELRSKDGFSIEDAEPIGQTVTHIMNGLDSYFNAKQRIYEWCGVAKQLLGTYIKQLDKAESSGAQKTILVRVLGNEIDKMNRAEQDLDAISSSFHEAAAKMTTVKNRLRSKSDAKSKSIVSLIESFVAKLDKAQTDLGETKKVSHEKIKPIESLKSQIEGTPSYVSSDELRHLTVQSVQHLIADCEEYRKLQTV